MGNFTRQVRSGDIVGPLRRAFTPERFGRAYVESPETDAEDASTLAAGLAISKKLTAIRSALSLSTSDALSATTKVRAFLAVANHAFFVAGDKTRSAIEAFQAEQTSGEADAYTLEEMAGIKVTLSDGFAWLPNEIIESVVDGIQLPLRVVLQGTPALTGSPKLNAIKWEEASLELNLGIMYVLAEDIWDECLWNGYRVIEQTGGKAFVPRDWDVVRAYRIGLARRTSLSTAFTLVAGELQRRVLAQGRQLRIREVTGIERQKKRQVIKVARPGVATDVLQGLAIQRSLAIEPYYGELVDEPLASLGGASLSSLIDAWMVIASVAQVMVGTVSQRHALHLDDERPHVWMPNYVPTVQFSALVNALSAAADINRIQGEKLIEFLTYRGNSAQEIWSQPLVPVGPDTLTPVFAAVVSPNLRRLIDVWMRQAGIDLARRGPAFEAHVRGVASKAISDSSLLSQVAACISEDYTFRPPSGRQEQIDLVFSIGNTVFVTEAKCILEPTDAKGIALHRKTVLGAAEQALRKAKALEDHRTAFVLDVEHFGMKLHEGFKVVPLVIVSTSTHVGIAANGVPVIDEYLLGRYLDGSLSDYLYQPDEQNLSEQSKIVFYTNAAEAEERAPEYFARPPQMKRFLDGLQPRIVPLYPIDGNDWPGRIMTMECVAGGMPLSLQAQGTSIAISESRDDESESVAPTDGQS